MPTTIEHLLRSRACGIAARLLLTFPFWGSGLEKLFDFSGAMAEMRQFGLAPAGFYAALTIVTELGGAAAVVSGGRFTWLGAGALGVFTALTIPIAHAFWAVTGPAAQTEFFFAVEHVAVIGGLLAASVLSARPRPVPVRADEGEPIHLAAG